MKYLLILLLALCSLTARAQSITAEKPVSLITNGDFTSKTNAWRTSGGDALRTEVIAANVSGKKQALRLAFTPPADANPWTVQINQPSLLAIHKEDAVYVRVWLRSPDKARIGIVYEMATAPNTKYINTSANLTEEWKEYRFVGIVPQDFAAGMS